jgi:hypothetical protein
MKISRIYPTREEIQRIAEIKKKYKLDENRLSSYVPKKLYHRREKRYDITDQNACKA